MYLLNEVYSLNLIKFYYYVCLIKKHLCEGGEERFLQK